MKRKNLCASAIIHGRMIDLERLAQEEARVARSKNKTGKKSHREEELEDFQHLTTSSSLCSMPSPQIIPRVLLSSNTNG
jgi:hypothetical protein